MVDNVLSIQRNGPEFETVAPARHAYVSAIQHLESRGRKVPGVVGQPGYLNWYALGSIKDPSQNIPWRQST